MKKRNIFLIIAVIFIAVCLLAGIVYLNKQKDTASNVNNNQSAPDKPDFLFSIGGNDLEIKDKVSGELVQKIPFSEYLIPDILRLSIENVVAFNDDVNFDGYKDLQILTMMAATNTLYDYYVYNPSAKEFQADRNLKNLGDPAFDSETKTINTYMINGCAGADFSLETFSFINGEYILTSTSRGACCSFKGMEETPLITTSELKNGKMEITGTEPCPQ